MKMFFQTLRPNFQLIDITRSPPVGGSRGFRPEPLPLQNIKNIINKINFQQKKKRCSIIKVVLDSQMFAASVDRTQCLQI